MKRVRTPVNKAQAQSDSLEFRAPPLAPLGLSLQENTSSAFWTASGSQAVRSGACPLFDMVLVGHHVLVSNIFSLLFSY